MVELNDSPPRPIKYVSPYSFSIEDTTGYSAYTREGIVEQVKVPSKLSFKSWDESNVNPLLEEPLNIPDLGKFGRSEQLHFAFRAVREFQKNKGHLPQLHNAEDADEVLRIAQELNQAGKDSEGFSVDEVEGDVVRNVSLYARAQISPMAAFWGGIVAQEVIKFTGKYTPLRQWLHFDSFEIITEDADKAPKNTRYDD